MADVVEIVCSDRGPLRITGGPFIIKDGNGNSFDLGGRTSIALCRCGQSVKKPFCDGAHSRCDFDSAVVAVALPPKNTD